MNYYHQAYNSNKVRQYFLMLPIHVLKVYIKSSTNYIVLELNVS